MRLQDTNELPHLSITEASQRLRAGTLSPVTLTKACLDRIMRLDRELHAFITLTADQALSEAQVAEEEIRAGRYRGPLHGIPIAHKDIVCTSGVRTTAHSNQLRAWVPTSDATVYVRLREAGTICLGKLGCWEFAYGNPGPSVAFPPPRNPWNPAYSPGGSSSGSGTAVAAAMCFGATGTDTGGSIRHPASVCAIVGMKTTFGRVSVDGVLPLAPSLDTVGPMTRTVRDNAIMLQAMAAYDPKDLNSSRQEVPDFQRLIGHSLSGLRIGVPRRFIETSVHPYEEECLAAFDRALKQLCDLGAVVHEFDMPVLADTADLTTRILRAEAALVHKKALAESPEKFDVSLREQLLIGTRYTDGELREAEAARAALKRAYAELFANGTHIIASPGREGIADTMEMLMTNPIRRRGSTTRMYNLAGLPALVMPMGFGRDAMPLGIQFASAPFAEDRIYQVAAAYEDATSAFIDGVRAARSYVGSCS